MLILTIKTDNPTAEIGLYDNYKKIDYTKWQAHRELSKTIHKKIIEILKSNNYNLNNVKAIACFEGPGSFTGLRIGISTVNALGASLNIPVIASGNKDWINQSINQILNDNFNKVAIPNYGEEAKVTKPKK